MITRDDIEELDAQDSLAPKRTAFGLPGDVVYLDGNSLGALPLASRERVLETIEAEWGEGLIRSWNTHNWIDLPQIVGEKIAPLIGAGPGQVICTDSISVNLFKLLALGLELRAGRSRILSTEENFPTDLYMVQGLEALLGHSRCRLEAVAEDKLLTVIDESVALLLLSHVNFRSGRILPMRSITAAAHAVGALVIWDLAHSAGALPVELDDCEVDFAVGCGYKYLNGGPGAPAFIYVAERHQDRVQQPLSGWMGHRQPFAFDPAYVPGRGMLQFLCGTPPVLSMASLDAALELFNDIGIASLREKSLALSTLFIGLVEQSELAADLHLLSPRDATERGSQLAWSHPQAYGLCQAWIERGVIADYREPDLLRVGFSPLYNSFRDVWTAVEKLRELVQAGDHLDARWRVRQQVT